MRNFYLILGSVFALIAFIYAMENMWLRAPAMFMFFKGTYIIGVLLLIMMLIAMISGFFFGLFMGSHKDDDDTGDDIFE